MLGFVPQDIADCHWQVPSACVTSPSAFVMLEVRASACGATHSGQVIVLSSLAVPTDYGREHAHSEALPTTTIPTSHWFLVCCKCRLPPARLARSYQAASDVLIAAYCVSPSLLMLFRYPPRENVEN